MCELHEYPKSTSSDDTASSLTADGGGLADLAPILSPPLETSGNLGLMGTPSEDNNLLGSGRRPLTRTELRDRVAAELLNSPLTVPEDPINVWMTAFDRTVDEYSVDAVLPGATSLYTTDTKEFLRYEPQLFDSSLRSAADLLDRCMESRTEMRMLEISGVNTGLAYLGFLKLRLIQNDLITQASNEDLDQLAKEVEQRTKDIYDSKPQSTSDYERVRLLGLTSESDGSVQQADLLGRKDHIKNSLLKQQYEIQSEIQLAQFAGILDRGSASNYAERYLRILTFLTEDLSEAYSALFSASKGVQRVLGISQVSIIVRSDDQNHSPAKRLIDVDIPEFEIEEDVEAWVRKILPVNVSDPRKPDVVDAMIVWCRAVMRELDRRARYETEFTLSIPLSQPIAPTNMPIVDVRSCIQNSKGSETYRIPFTLSQNQLPMPGLPSDLRVLGIGLSFLHDMSDYLPVQFADPWDHAEIPIPVQGAGIRNPEPTVFQIRDARITMRLRTSRINATLTTPKQRGIASDYARPKVYLSNVRMEGGLDGDIETPLSYDPACRNLSPFGEWRIDISQTAVTNETDATVPFPTEWIAGLVLHLRVRGTT